MFWNNYGERGMYAHQDEMTALARIEGFSAGRGIHWQVSVYDERLRPDDSGRVYIAPHVRRLKSFKHKGRLHDLRAEYVFGGDQ